MFDRGPEMHNHKHGWFTLTFDDASRSHLELGLPALARHGVRGVAFVPTGLTGGFFEREPIMTVDELRELADAGWEMGSHTVTHPRLAKDGVLQVSRDDLEREIADSQTWLLEHGFEAVAFAYPYGRYNDEVESQVARYYRYARTTADGLNTPCAAHSRLRSYSLCQRKVPRWKTAVDQAASRSAWLIGVVHHITVASEFIPSDDEKSWVTYPALEEAIAYALDAGLKPATFADIHQLTLDKGE